MGLKDAGQIGIVIIHPTNPDIVWLAALGSPFGPNAERGIFKTTDGGKTWKKTLFVNNETGGRVRRDQLLEPERALRRDVSRLPQGLGHHQRRSRDRGRHLQVDRRRRHVERSSRRGCRRRSSARSTSTSRAASPTTVYAMVEAPGAEGGLYRSNDSGATLEAGEQRGEPALASVLLPLRRRQPEEPERSLGQRARRCSSPATAASRSRPSRRRTATTTASGSIPTIRSTRSSATTAAPT